MARMGQLFSCTEPSLPGVTTITDSKIGMRVSCRCPFPRHRSAQPGQPSPDEAVHAVEVLPGMSAGNVPREKWAVGSDCLRQLSAGAGGSGAGRPGSARTCTPISSRKPLLSVRKVVSDEKRPGYSSAHPSFTDSLKALPRRFAAISRRA